MSNLTEDGMVQELNHARTSDRIAFVGVLTKGVGLRLRDRLSVRPLQLEGDAVAAILHPPVPDDDPPPSADGSFGPEPDDVPEYTVRCWVDGPRCGAEIFHREAEDGSEKSVATWDGEFIGDVQDVDAVRIAAIAIAKRQLDL